MGPLARGFVYYITISTTLQGIVAYDPGKEKYKRRSNAPQDQSETGPLL